MTLNRRTFLGTAAATVAAASSARPFSPCSAAVPSPLPSLIGNRFLTFNTVVRVNQVEAGRNQDIGVDEAAVHTPAAVQALRDTFGRGWPGGRMTWAFSWRALQDQRGNYQAIRDLVRSYHKQYGDEITFFAGGYFANMYNSRAQVNRDLHDALGLVAAMVGGGYRPRSVLAGYLAAENQRYLAEEEGIHVCQGNIWSQYAVDFGDGDGSICYPYYPSREHFCKPAQGKRDFIDCVNLDGWTMDFLCAPPRSDGRVQQPHGRRSDRNGLQPGRGSGRARDDGDHRRAFRPGLRAEPLRLGDRLLGGVPAPDGRLQRSDPLAERGPAALAAGAVRYARGVRHGMARALREQCPAQLPLCARGSGIHGSEENLEIRWFMNRDFRLALLRDWKLKGPEMVIDLTRYDLPAAEPQDKGRNWSLMNRINQKQTRPQDKPIPLAQLTPAEHALIRRHYPELFGG